MAYADKEECERKRDIAFAVNDEMSSEEESESDDEEERPRTGIARAGGVIKHYPNRSSPAVDGDSTTSEEEESDDDEKERRYDEKGWNPNGKWKAIFRGGKHVRTLRKETPI